MNKSVYNRHLACSQIAALSHTAQNLIQFCFTLEHTLPADDEADAVKTISAQFSQHLPPSHALPQVPTHLLGVNG
jgi:hypothetical protein